MTALPEQYPFPVADAETPCEVCGRRIPETRAVCDACRQRIRVLLRDLPSLVTRLRLELMPAPTGVRERVRTAASASLPVRLDVLCLAGPGNAHLVAPSPTASHPMIRRWTTQQVVDVHVQHGGHSVTERRTVTVWHREVVAGGDGQPVMVTDDDQAGLLPPAVWTDLWISRWRHRLGFRRPTRTASPPADVDQPARLMAAVQREAMLHTACQPYGRPLVAALLTLQQAYRQYVAGLATGMRPGHGGERATGERGDDPLAEEWEIRFGAATAAASVDVDVHYLELWLDEACDRGLDVDVFAAELRALYAELSAVLGDRPDQQWLGRCPTPLLIDRVEGLSEPCGYGLWHDPHCSEIQCGRCHSTWHEQTWIQLAEDIRAVWPVDPRRRYDDTERAQVPPLVCARCGACAQVSWRQGRDREAGLWQPVEATCTAGCDITVGEVRAHG